MIYAECRGFALLPIEILLVTYRSLDCFFSRRRRRPESEVNSSPNDETE